LAREIQEAVEAGYYCPVFLNFTQSIDTLSKLLEVEGAQAAIFDGRDHKKREAGLDSFMKGTQKVILLQTQAGGASIDLHDLDGSRPRMTFLSPTYHAESLVQALGRVVRFGAKSPVIQRIIFSQGTVEERVFKIVEGKASQIRALNDGVWKDAFGG
jgi:SNF2 family DNA or RNA helicase